MRKRSQYRRRAPDRLVEKVQIRRESETVVRTDSVAVGGDSTFDFEDPVRRHAEIYANHLVLSACIRGWSDRMVSDLSAGERSAAPPANEDDYLRGYIRALRDLAEHLFEGDGLPGGPLTKETR